MDPVKKHKNHVVVPVLFLAVFLLCNASGAASIAVNPVVTANPANLVLVTTITQAPLCQEPCECMAQASALEKWGANGYSQCSQTACYRLVTGSAVIPFYCFRPLTIATTPAPVTCRAPCECLERTAAAEKWGANGFSQCSERACGYSRAVTGAPVTKYCYQPSGQPVVAVSTGVIAKPVTVPVSMIAVRPTVLPVTINTSLFSTDTDKDGILDFQDNCPYAANADQQDTDPGLSICGLEGDGPGVTPQPCTTMAPGDGVGDVCDNCPALVNPDQKDSDAITKCSVLPESMGGGTKCDVISDNKGDACDNCPLTFNPEQYDHDGDGIGDDCDNCEFRDNWNQLDSDGDKIGNACDLCPQLAANAAKSWEQDKDLPGHLDTDNDDIGNACDNCPNTANPFQTDNDHDGFGNECDNCVVTANAAQTDSDTDGLGNSCDNCPYAANPGQADADGNGAGDACQDPCTMNVNNVASFSWTTWRGTDWMTSVKDQAACGSCYAEAPTGTLEAMYNLQQGSQQNLDTAEQVFVSPCFSPDPGSCLGGSQGQVLNHIRDRGVPDESVMPYQSTACVHSVPNTGDPTKTHLECNAGIGAHCSVPNSCNMGALAPDHVWKTTSFGSSSGTVSHVKQQLLCKGPLAVCSGKWWHCVVLVGWDNNVNGGSWLIKNSWGTGWENNGYGWIRYTGEDRSEIRNDATYMSGIYRFGGA